MDFCRIETFELLDILPYIVSVGIKLYALCPWVEDAEPRASVVSASDTPLPASIIRCKVAVDQALHKESLTESPINQEMLR